MSNPTNMKLDDFVDYLEKHEIHEHKPNSNKTEVMFACPFGGCDKDHRRGEEFHCNFNLEKCVYHCVKCGAKGNFVTLRKHFGDCPRSVGPIEKAKSLDVVAEKFNRDLPTEYRQWLNARGINDTSIDRFKLGYCKHINKEWISIPICNHEGKVVYFKLRNLDEDEKPSKYMVIPTKVPSTLYGIEELVTTKSNDILICEGEFDRIVALQEGVKMPVITAGGARLFSDEWVRLLKDMRNIYVCMDLDKTGEESSNDLIRRLSEQLPGSSIYKISLPPELGTSADISDYFWERKGTADELFSKYAEWVGGIKPIDESKFKEMTVDDIADVLDLTIKEDKANKVITLLSMLLTYTDSDALNVMFNAGSSSGKTYLCTEIAKLFPSNDVKIYGRTSSTALYYNESLQKEDPETKQKYIDLERRILIFTEQPNTQLMENLRAFLSHDSKRTPFLITNKGKNGANKAVESYILGFSSTLFCTANMRIDEQEQTRSLILSPEGTKEKIIAGIQNCIDRGSNKELYDTSVDEDEGRESLKDRIIYVKQLNITDIDIEDKGYLREKFMSRQKNLALRNQRDVNHFMSLVKAMALINAPFRQKKSHNRLVATNKDVDEALRLWDSINESIFYGVPPQVLDIYKTQILPVFYALNEGNTADRENWPGMSYDTFSKEYFRQTGRFPNWDYFRKMIIPALQCASLISYEKDEGDKRVRLITPRVFFD